MLAKGLLLTYSFATGLSYTQAIRESTLIETGKVTSQNTVADWYSYCREVTGIYLDGLYEERGSIGGEGHVIQIDEMKLGKRKFNRGRMVEGNWILGMIDEDTNEIRLEICPNNKRDSITLLALIQKHVKQNSTIFTDCWKGYSNLSANDFEHWTVNHRLHFVNPETKVHTNKIESQWRGIRKRLTRGGIAHDKLAEHLCEYLWRRDVKRRDVDMFNDLLSIICKQFPGVGQ